MLYSRRVKPSREAAFKAWAHGVVAAARQFPGHLGASVLDAPGSREYYILFTFADRKACGPGSTPRSAGGGWPG